MSEAKWYLRTADQTFGPESEEKLVEWAQLGRILPGQEISDDNETWRKAEDIPFLDMRFSIDIGDGNPRGPFNKVAAETLLASGRLPKIAKLVEVRESFPEDPAPSRSAEVQQELDLEPAKEQQPPPPPPEPQSKPEEAPTSQTSPQIVRVEVPVTVEKIVEVPVEKIVEKLVEVPIERVVEKLVVKEVPVEKIVEKEVEKVVVDERRVKELEGLLEEERRHTSELQKNLEESTADALRRASEARRHVEELQTRMAETAKETEAREALMRKHADDAATEALRREEKLKEQIAALEDEIRRLPQTASEVASIQAAVYTIMTKEAEELAAELELERKEAEELRRRHADRSARLLERRHSLLKRAGSNIEEMTRRALINRPEDPRTAQLRREFEDAKRLHERENREAQTKIASLTESLRLAEAERRRSAEKDMDITSLRREMQILQDKLSQRERELVMERERSEELERQHATSHQTMLKRLASLESPSIGTSSSLATNQSREARMVKLPRWMNIGK